MANNVFDFLVNAVEMESCQVPAQNIPDEYDRASRKADSYYEKIKAVLPPEMQDALYELDGERCMMEMIGKNIYYRKGFSDALRLIFQALFWEPHKS